MLRRTLALTSLLTLALAIPIERSTPPPTADPCAESNTTLNLSPGELHALGLLAPSDCEFRITTLFLPRVAYAQAVASTPAQTVSDQSVIAQADTGPGSVDTAADRSAPAESSNSHGILWGTLAAIALMTLGVWFWRRKSGNELVGYGHGNSGGVAKRSEVDERGHHRTRGGP